MCGLVAIVSSTPSKQLVAQASAMLDTLRHRGPDDRQIIAFDDEWNLVAPDRPARVVLAHQRLAILDLTNAGRQPMCDPQRRTWIIFNGEIYNFIELAGDLRRDGVELRSRCDTEVLVDLLATQGEAALDRLDGMFAFVSIDVRNRRILVARDRFGIKPLYVWRTRGGDSGDACVFASEIKAFTTHLSWRAALNAPRAVDFLRRGIIDHTDETLFADVKQVPAGSLATIDLDDASLALRSRRWYDLALVFTLSAMF